MSNLKKTSLKKLLLEKKAAVSQEDVILKLANLPHRRRLPSLLSVTFHLFFLHFSWMFSFFPFCSLRDCGKSSVQHENFVISIRNVTSSLSSDQFCPLTICLFCLCLRRLRVCVRSCTCVLVSWLCTCLCVGLSSHSDLIFNACCCIDYLCSPSAASYVSTPCPWLPAPSGLERAENN